MRRIVYLLAVILFACGLALSQEYQLPDASSRRPPSRTNSLDPQFGRRRNEANDRRLEQEREKRANKERQERIKHDTDKLLQLATELKHYVDKTNENMLSLEVIRKAEEIEKLAHDVRKRMKD